MPDYLILYKLYRFPPYSGSDYQSLSDLKKLTDKPLRISDGPRKPTSWNVVKETGFETLVILNSFLEKYFHENDIFWSFSEIVSNQFLDLKVKLTPSWRSCRGVFPFRLLRYVVNPSSSQIDNCHYATYSAALECSLYDEPTEEAHFLEYRIWIFRTRPNELTVNGICRYICSYICTHTARWGNRLPWWTPAWRPAVRRFENGKIFVQAIKFYAPNDEFWLWKFIGEAWENCKAKAGQNELKKSPNVDFRSRQMRHGHWGGKKEASISCH